VYKVQKNGQTIFESDACGIGFIASRKGVYQRSIVDLALDLTQHFDHRGAPGHGAGFQLDIPWPILLDRFPRHAKKVAQHDVALGMFFFPVDDHLRAVCMAKVEEIAAIAGAHCLDWAEVPINPAALPSDSSALQTMPKVFQAIFARPEGMGQPGWLACRYLLRLALDNMMTEIAGEDFTLVSLSNRTVVYKGLAELSKIGDLYPDLRHADFQTRYVLFHSRYCTNTTTAWRRAQPFWGIAHNGEISTINGNTAWMKAIGGDLTDSLVAKNPSLAKLASYVGSIICSGGSDTANLDDMMIALIAGGMSFPQAMLGLLPSAESVLPKDDPLHDFYRAARVYIGACDGPAALVGCDGDVAVAHLDRNGLRPLWTVTAKDYVLAVSELTGSIDLGEIEDQRVLGPGETCMINLRNGRVMIDGEVREVVAREPFPTPMSRITPSESTATSGAFADLKKTQIAFGMTKEDIEVIIQPMTSTGKPALGSMGDDTAPAAILDLMPRRIEDHFKLRFAQETSPPIDPIRDEWVFDTTAVIGDRSGMWGGGKGRLFSYNSRVISDGELTWLSQQDQVVTVSLTIDPAKDIEFQLDEKISEACDLAENASVLVLSDRTQGTFNIPSLRMLSRLHSALVQKGIRHKVGLVVDGGIWDVHHCALHVTLGADLVCPWLGIFTAENNEEKYLKALRSGLIEAMSMMGVTPSVAYCGASLVESLGLDFDFVKKEFPGVYAHLSGIGAETLNQEWLMFFEQSREGELVDVGEYRHTKNGRRHANNADIVRSLHSASGYTKKIHEHQPGSKEAYNSYSALVSGRSPLSILDLFELKPGRSISIDEVEPVENILFRFMAPGMSEGALSEPAHRAVAQAFNTLSRYCQMKGIRSAAIGPVANSGEGGFDKNRIGKRDGNRSVQYSGGRFTITPMTASLAAEAEVKFAQGAKPGKGGQLPGKKVSPAVALRRGCEPGYELVSPPINHNLYSIEDVKLMIESWRHLNPAVNCSLKFVATTGVEMVAVGGVNAGANRIHISDGCGGTGAAKRVDQKHAGLPAALMLPKVHDTLISEGIRDLVEVSTDGGVQNGEQALKLMLLGADRVGFGTSLLVAIGCSMLRKCHLSGPDPSDPTGKRKLGCTPGIATQDPDFIARFSGKSRHIVRFLNFIAEEIRERMATAGIASLDQVIGQRDLLQVKPNLTGKAALLSLESLLKISENVTNRDYAKQSVVQKPKLRNQEIEAAHFALKGNSITIEQHVSNDDRCVGVSAAGAIARVKGDLGLEKASVTLKHHGAAGHYYAAYSVKGMNFIITGNIADSAFTAAYGGELVVMPVGHRSDLSIVGNCFAYGARGGSVFIAGRAGNRFGICLRKNHEGGGATIVVEGVGANGFQYMTGGAALVLGPTGPNLGAGMTGGVVYALDLNEETLNTDYVQALPVLPDDILKIKSLLKTHLDKTDSQTASHLLKTFDSARFKRIATKVPSEWLPEWSVESSLTMS
jgi:glutamate synthase (ferredoxin)